MRPIGAQHPQRGDMVATMAILNDEIFGVVIVELVALDHLVMRNVPLEGVDEHTLSIGVHRAHQCSADADIVAVYQAYHAKPPSLEGWTLVMQGALTLPRKGRIDSGFEWLSQARESRISRRM